MPIWDGLKEAVSKTWPFVRDSAKKALDFISGWWHRFQGRIGEIRTSLGGIWDTAKGDGIILLMPLKQHTIVISNQ